MPQTCGTEVHETRRVSASYGTRCESQAWAERLVFRTIVVVRTTELSGTVGSAGRIGVRFGVTWPDGLSVF